MITHSARLASFASSRSRAAQALALSALLGLGLAASACGDGGSSSSNTATPAPASTTTPAPANTTTPAPANTTTPASATPEPTLPVAKTDPCAPPEGSLRGDAAAGATTYGQVCTACHGPDAPPLQPKPADHNDCGYMTSLSDEHIYRTVCGGGAAVGKSPTMPVLGLKPPQIKNVLAHLRTLCPTE